MFKESDIVLSAKHIVKQFPASHGRTLTACNDINLNVYKGKTLGIVGESGCGKSTFVRMVISLDKPTSGEILYHGKNLADLSKKETWLNRQNMQMVFQDPLASFNPKMKIVDILTEPLINFGRLKKSEKEAKARELLEMVELPGDFVDRYPHNMSGGQRQRISIASWNRRSWFAMRRLLHWTFLYRNLLLSFWYAFRKRKISVCFSSAMTWH